MKKPLGPEGDRKSQPESRKWGGGGEGKRWLAKRESGRQRPGKLCVARARAYGERKAPACAMGCLAGGGWEDLGGQRGGLRAREASGQDCAVTVRAGALRGDGEGSCDGRGGERKAEDGRRVQGEESSPRERRAELGRTLGPHPGHNFSVIRRAS